MIAFYFFNSSEFQDMLAPLIEISKTGRKVWVCFFDCLEKKRCFFNYGEKELVSFIDSIFLANGLGKPDVNFYGQESEYRFNSDYKNVKPSAVFMQGIHHKYPIWMPHTAGAKVVHFAWGADGFNNLIKSKINVDFNVLRNEEDAEIFSQAVSRSKFFGKFWLDQLVHNPVASKLTKELTGKKSCFIPETWVSGNANKTLQTWNEHNVHGINDFIKFLHDEDYLVICKRREKGYPFHDVHGWSNYVTEKPDIIIEKDLYYPSSLFALPLLVDACVIFGHTTPGTISLHNMMKSLNSKSILAKAQSLPALKDFILSNVAEYNNNIVLESPTKHLIKYLEVARILEAP